MNPEIILQVLKDYMIPIFVYPLILISYVLLVLKVKDLKNKSGLDSATWLVMALLNCYLTLHLYFVHEYWQLTLLFAVGSVAVASMLMYTKNPFWITRHHIVGIVLCATGGCITILASWYVIFIEEYFNLDRLKHIGGYVGFIGVAVIMFPQFEYWIKHPYKNPQQSWVFSTLGAGCFLFSSKNYEFDYNIQAYSLLIGSITCWMIPVFSKMLGYYTPRGKVDVSHIRAIEGHESLNAHIEELVRRIVFVCGCDNEEVPRRPCLRDEARTVLKQLHTSTDLISTKFTWYTELIKDVKDFKEIECSVGIPQMQFSDFMLLVTHDFEKVKSELNKHSSKSLFANVELPDRTEVMFELRWLRLKKRTTWLGLWGDVERQKLEVIRYTLPAEIISNPEEDMVILLKHKNKNANRNTEYGIAKK